MHKPIRIALALTLVFLILGTLSASADSVNGNPALLNWTDQIFKDGEDGIVNLSTEFVGPHQVPMLSYNRSGSHHIYQAFKATSAVPGNCGPNNGWYCDSWQDSALTPGTVSNMATINYIDTHAIRWVYSTGSTIRGVYLELMNDMSYVNADWMDLVQISKFGSTLIGAPSIKIESGGHYEMAFTVLGGGDLYPYSLVYMTYVGGSNTSCSSVASGYECVVVDTSLGYNSMGSPSISITGDGSRTGIAYYKNGAVRYAYPHTPGLGVPSNCGPGGDTWRCITIFSGDATGTVGQTVKLAMGQISADRAILFTYDDVLIPLTLYHADYVGSDGNCGLDLSFGGISDYRWQCDDMVGYNYLGAGETPSFSLDIDQQGYSVIAYDNRLADLGNNDLYLLYPIARTGNPGTGWLVQKIDYASSYDVDTGAQASVALSATGMGFISYIQEELYQLDDLKIAFQLYQATLPIVSKP